MTIVTLPLPIQLVNGTVADAGQVMTDLNAIASNVNTNAAKNGVNSDITSLTALTTINAGVTMSGEFITNSTITGGTIVGAAIDTTTTAVTQPVGTNTTQLATMAAIFNQILSTVLPNQAGNSGKFISTNGVVADWRVIPGLYMYDYQNFQGY